MVRFTFNRARKQQAKNAKIYFKNINFDNYYCSTSERTSNTLEIIIGDKPYTRLKGIKERNFGVFEGESEDLHPFKDGKLYLDETYPIYYNDETSKEVQDRVFNTITTIMENDNKTVLVVSHGGACHVFYDKVVGKYGKDVEFTNCCIMHYQYDNNEFKFNEIIDPNN